ncbi:hypothetical protein DUNSADRAFT_1206 [Dunaliella salina]|uniref:Uncharacterized protein n=1 Tax=Dunaliella salina TaxID=3046 RepID=A0ABQ7GXG3_DUNSA|nr:hypothetical protein DUNSADRAFT_1206 [Dunaliella salina]|eukprot:KAF5839262.1 hypothetical protein DUNSADRAFT_1206 [Dunaliella salina]
MLARELAHMHARTHAHMHLHGLFVNPWSTTWKEKGLADVLKWANERNKQGVSSAGWLAQPYRPYPSKEELLARFPLNPVVHAEIPRDAVQALWVGHATVLTRMAGVTFITDPVFSKRCAPVQWAGPARVVPPAFEIEDTKALPHLDFVLIR